MPEGEGGGGGPSNGNTSKARRRPTSIRKRQSANSGAAGPKKHAAHDIDYHNQKGCSCESFLASLGFWIKAPATSPTGFQFPSSAGASRAEDAGETTGPEDDETSPRTPPRQKNVLSVRLNDQNEQEQVERSSNRRSVRYQPSSNRRRPDALHGLNQGGGGSKKRTEPPSPTHEMGDGSLPDIPPPILTPSSGERFQEMFAPSNPGVTVTQAMLLDNFLIAFSEGQKVIIHSKEIAPRKALLFIEGEDICWNFDSAYYSLKKGLRRMPLASVIEVKLEKTGEAFQRKGAADDAPDKNCITIVSPDKALAIQFTNAVCVDAFSQGVLYYMQLKGSRKGGIAAAATSPSSDLSPEG